MSKQEEWLQYVERLEHYLCTNAIDGLGEAAPLPLVTRSLLNFRLKIVIVCSAIPHCKLVNEVFHNLSISFMQ